MDSDLIALLAGLAFLLIVGCFGMWLIAKNN